MRVVIYCRYRERSELARQKKASESWECVEASDAVDTMIIQRTCKSASGGIPTRKSEPCLASMGGGGDDTGVGHGREDGAGGRIDGEKGMRSEGEDDDDDETAGGAEGEGTSDDVMSRLQQLEVYVTALFAMPVLVNDSVAMKNFFELPVPIDVNLIRREPTVDQDVGEARSEGQSEENHDDYDDDGQSRGVSIQGQFVLSMLMESDLLDSESVQELRMFLSLGDAGSYRMAFSTRRDGWSIDTLYALTAKKSPCIILIRALETQALVGAFLPVAMSPPSPDVRGDGRAFVFRLDGDNAGYYKWDNRSSSSGRGGEMVPYGNMMVSSMGQAHQQFAICTREYIMIGGSSVYGTNALRVDAELQTCFSGPSDTFNNPALVPEETRQPFVIGKSCFGRSTYACLLCAGGCVRHVVWLRVLMVHDASLCLLIICGCMDQL
jgi:hypothetical protein